MSDPSESSTPAFEFDEAFQKKIAGHVMRDDAFMRRAGLLVKKENFEDEGLRWLTGYATEFFVRFQQTPSLEVVLNDLKDLIAAKRIKPETVDAVKPHMRDIYGGKVDLSNRDYMVEKVSEFAKKCAVENAILRGAEILDKGGSFEEINRLMTEAMQVGANEEGVFFEFWSTAKERTDARAERMAPGKRLGITTGVKELDNALYHGGWGRGELNVLMGPPKAGKSIGLGEFAINASEAGHDVLYLSLENSAAIVGDRMDANVSTVTMRDLVSSPGSIRGSVDTKGVKAGKLFVHEFPTGTLKPSDIRRLISNYQSRGITFALIVIDYADIMAPDRSTGEERHDSAQIYRMIRAIGQQENAAILTATQTNREGAKATVAKMTDVSEDINRVRLADVFMILAANDQEKADDEFRLYLSAMRNSESGIMFRCKSDRKRMKFIKSLAKDSL